MAYAHNPPLMADADITSVATELNFGLYTPLHPHFVCGRCDSSGETAQMCRLILAFVASWYDKYQTLVWTRSPAH